MHYVNKLFYVLKGRGNVLISHPIGIESARHFAACKVFTLGDLSILFIGPGHAKMCFMPCANNKGTDQPAHPRSLISTFVVRCLDSVICIVAISKVSRL